MAGLALMKANELHRPGCAGRRLAMRLSILKTNVCSPDTTGEQSRAAVSVAILIGALISVGCEPKDKECSAGGDYKVDANELVAKAEHLLASEQPVEAVRILESVMERGPDETDLQALYGRALAESCEWEKALEFLQPSQHLYIGACQLALGNAQRALREFKAVYESTMLEGDLCFLARVAEVGGDTAFASEVWKKAREVRSDPVLITVSFLSSASRDKPVPQDVRCPRLSTGLINEYRAERVLAYLAYYGVVAFEDPPFIKLKQAFEQPGSRMKSIYNEAELNKLADIGIGLAYAGDAGAFTALGDGFYIRGDLAEALVFYKLAVARRPRMIEIQKAAWAAFQILRIETAREAEAANRE